MRFQYLVDFFGEHQSLGRGLQIEDAGQMRAEGRIGIAGQAVFAPPHKVGGARAQLKGGRSGDQTSLERGTMSKSSVLRGAILSVPEGSALPLPAGRAAVTSLPKRTSQLRPKGVKQTEEKPWRKRHGRSRSWSFVCLVF